MREIPILFNGRFVKEILAGRKTQTRRPVKPQPQYRLDPCPDGSGHWGRKEPDPSLPGRYWMRVPKPVTCPFGKPGDRLWLKEKHACIPGNSLAPFWYLADGPLPTISERHDAGLLKTFAAIRLPRWASRILLEVTDVRIERVQDISEADAKAEGMERLVYGVDYHADTGYKPEPFVRSIDSESDERIASHTGTFHFEWDCIYEKDGFGWKSNPWVWVVKFNRVGE